MIQHTVFPETLVWDQTYRVHMTSNHILAHFILCIPTGESEAPIHTQIGLVIPGLVSANGKDKSTVHPSTLGLYTPGRISSHQIFT